MVYHLVLAAPDIDADTFKELAAAFQKLSGRVTLYESSKDKALQASRKVHGNPRAGEPLLIIPGMDTIDASASDTDFLAHSYFSDNWPLLSDIHSLLFKDDPQQIASGCKRWNMWTGNTTRSRRKQPDAQVVRTASAKDRTLADPRRLLERTCP
jgi:esterase/lipase superfamily enzyme